MPYLKPPASPSQQSLLPQILPLPSNPFQVKPTSPESEIPTSFQVPADKLKVSHSGSAQTSLSLNPEPAFILHKVRRGDTLTALAQKYLGDAQRHLEIFEANRETMRNPNDLSIGMTLKIPVDTAVTPPDEPEPATETPTPPVAEPVATTVEYRVKRGDSLSSIALRTLGDAERYLEIFQFNRDQMKNPDDLRPGMVLKIPKTTSPPAAGANQPKPVKPAEPVNTIDTSNLTPGARELLEAMQRYQQYHAQRGNTHRTRTTPEQMYIIARELDAAAKAFGVDPKLMLALFAHESGGINPNARSHTGAGGLGQLTSVAIRQVHYMAGIGKGGRGVEPYNQYRQNFIQNTRSIRERYDIKANIWTSVAYMNYELNERAFLGRGIANALKRYGDPTVAQYAQKVNAEYQVLFGQRLF